MSIDPESAMAAVNAALGEAPAQPAPGALSPVGEGGRSPASQPASQTALDFIGSQEALEAEARDILPYSFDTCTKEMGPLRQNLYACITCNPPPENLTDPYTPAGVCYSCSISCHGEHELVELFTRRNFVCDCGTTRIPESTQCTLRVNQTTESKGVHSEEPASTNTYNQNFRNRFCSCAEWYDPQKQKGTMFQCIGLATEEEGGCGEDWWHPECLMGLPRDWHTKLTVAGDSDQSEKKEAETNEDGTNPLSEEHPVPPGFPDEEMFDHLICYKCVAKAPFLKRYASTQGFIGLPNKTNGSQETSPSNKEVKAENQEEMLADEAKAEASKKRVRDELDENNDSAGPSLKKARSDNGAIDTQPSDDTSDRVCQVKELPAATVETISILLPQDFREKLCRCKDCYLQLRPFPMLLEEEETYEPPVSEEGGANGGGSVGTGSLLERGEAALSSVDRVRAIEGAMVFNHLKTKVKDFLKPFAENGKAVSAEEIKAYFEKLRGDHEAIRDARAKQGNSNDEEGGDEGDNRREQSGY